MDIRIAVCSETEENFSYKNINKASVNENPG
jgi:hypothetical protein